MRLGLGLHKRSLRKSGKNPNFIIRVKTDNAGTSNNDQVTLPLSGTYDIEYDGQVLTNQTGAITLTMPSGAGEYDISISPGLTRILFNNTGDKNKAIEIKNWGDIAWSTLSSAFFGCNNLIITAKDTPNLSNVSSLSNAFISAFSLNSSFNNWDVSNVTNMSGMFISCVSYDQTFEDWDITGVTNFSNFLGGASLSTANYNATLIGWEATLQATFPNGVGWTGFNDINFGGSQYTLGSAAETARNNLTDPTKFGIIITDGGGV